MKKIDGVAKHKHQWITVVNPTNRRLLLQACDNCGVVKSENSAQNRCAKPMDQHLITRAMGKGLLMVG
ncbi:MAG: hypothetical protein ACI9LY_002140 [Arenicella sp.]|jgi:hypothetical protein